MAIILLTEKYKKHSDVPTPSKGDVNNYMLEGNNKTFYSKNERGVVHIVKLTEEQKNEVKKETEAIKKLKNGDYSNTFGLIFADATSDAQKSRLITAYNAFGPSLDLALKLKNFDLANSIVNDIPNSKLTDADKLIIRKYFELAKKVL